MHAVRLEGMLAQHAKVGQQITMAFPVSLEWLMAPAG